MSALPANPTSTSTSSHDPIASYHPTHVAPHAQAMVAGYLLIDPVWTKDRTEILDRNRIRRFLPTDGLARYVYEAACDGYAGLGDIASILHNRGVATDQLPELLGQAPTDLPTTAIAAIDQAYERRCFDAVATDLQNQARNPARSTDEIVAATARSLATVPITARQDGILGSEAIQQYGQPNPDALLYPPARYVDGGTEMAYLRNVPLVEGSINVLAGPPGDGKSVAAWNIARIWAQGGAQVNLFSYEMSREGYLDWEYARLTGMDVGRLIFARKPSRKPARPFSPAEQKLMDDANAEILPWMQNIRFFDSDHQISLEDAPAIIRRLRLRDACDLVIVDHIQAAADTTHGHEIYDRVTRASSLIRQMATKIMTPFLVISHVSRDGRQYKIQPNDRTPIIRFRKESLKESGAIEQDASSVTFAQQVWADYSQGEQKIYMHANRSIHHDEVSILFQVVKNREGGGVCNDLRQPIVPGRFCYAPVQ